MPGRKYTENQKKERSELIQEYQPWASSCGAKSLEGKRVVRTNAITSGYFKEAHREFRKNRRSPEVRNIEKLVREAGKTKKDADFFNLIELIKTKLDDYYDRINQDGLSPSNVMEGTYLSCLVRTIVNNCATDRVIEELHRKQDQDACSCFDEPTC